MYSPGEPCTVFLRKLSCYCQPCDSEKFAECEKTSHVRVPEKHTLIPTTQASRAVTRAIQQEAQDPYAKLAELALPFGDCPDDNHHLANVAVFTDDEGYDYYLARVEQGVTKLTKKLTDDYGHTFPTGSIVIKGHYYEQVEGSANKWELDTSKTFCIYAHTVRKVHIKLHKVVVSPPPEVAGANRAAKRARSTSGGLSFPRVAVVKHTYVLPHSEHFAILGAMDGDT